MQNINKLYDSIISEKDFEISTDIRSKLNSQNSVVEILTKPKPIIKIYSFSKLTLTQIIPIIHSFKFEVIDELSYEIPYEKKSLHVNRFHLNLKECGQLEKTKSNVIEILNAYICGDINFKTHLFELVYKENFCLRGVMLFRAIINYADQLFPAFNNETLINTIVKNSTLAALFLKYFFIRFDPLLKTRDKKLQIEEDKVLEEIKKIQNITEDKIVKIIFSILKNTLRTNFFLHKDNISLKIDVAALKPLLNGIQPNIEIFVYHQNFNGTHLRMSNVSRGGLRWSDRHEDFRMEVKSLMAAQEGKNAVIIPSGAKGGLIIYDENVTKEDFSKYYSMFINALLDVVDNIVDGQVVPNEKMVKYDEDDPYFVVAADKGTAQMSDTANEIARKRNFWLMDAFASGGSHGYHHKKLGITAKGSIRSTHRFFIERGIDFYKESISVVGIGSMNGDVFGNGMLESKHFKLLAAISHSEIFIDPDPDVKVAYEERLRLFNSKDGKWSNYDKSKISKGGGVFKRSEKEIILSKEIQKLLCTNKQSLNAEELAKKILQIKVDMLYNGGVGTYFKSSNESNLDIGDKENEALRLNGADIKAYSVCEGGNLGLTQKARLEYALNGGRLNLDSIDNSAGVDTSDHEVNLKILLNTLIQKGLLSLDKRDETLQSLSEHVTTNVLLTNYLQSLSISLDERRSRQDIISFKKVIETLEKHLEYFHRNDFDIPKNVNISYVQKDNGEIIRPVLSILTLYSKLFLKKIINNSDLIKDDLYFEHILFKYFPKSFVAIYEDDIKRHPLRNEIISMMIANTIINFAGSTFISDYEDMGHEKFLIKIKAYLISNELFSANNIRFEIYRRDYDMKIKEQYSLLIQIEDAIEYNIQWMLKRLQNSDISFLTILQHKGSIEKILSELQIDKKCFNGACDMINHFFATLDYLKLATAIIHIKKSVDINFNEIATLFYYIMDKLEIILLLDYIAISTPKTLEENKLKEQLQRLIEIMIIDATKKILAFKRKDEEPKEVVNNYLNEKEMDYVKFQGMIEEIKQSEEPSLLNLTVIINYLILL